ncbi:MAG: hypothetical protein IMY67_11260 [Bacteroidetes bacterium]|nr:hypothetical protein [Bacteroidota bacterium]
MDATLDNKPPRLTQNEMDRQDKGKGVSFLILFICLLLAVYKYWDVKLAAEKTIELQKIEHKTTVKLFKEKAVAIQKENGKLKTTLIKVNSWVSVCWTCSKLKKADTTTTNFILELGQKN